MTVSVAKTAEIMVLFDVYRNPILLIILFDLLLVFREVFLLPVSLTSLFAFATLDLVHYTFLLGGGWGGGNPVLDLDQ